jgi:hypothetical protein
MSETDLLRALWLRANTLGCRLYRNNVGKLPDAKGRWITYGLCPGSSDLIGWKTVTVTPEMVGTRLAVFCGVEAKLPKGVVSQEQRAFLEALRAAGGYAILARELEDLWVLHDPPQAMAIVPDEPEV